MKYNTNYQFMTYLWICLTYLSAVVLNYNTVFCKDNPIRLKFYANVTMIKNLVFIAENTAVQLTCSINGSNVDISHEGGQLLNSSYETVSYTVKSKLCNESGNYICQGAKTIEEVVIVHINGCNPSLCDYKDRDKRIQAHLGTTVNFSICFIANVSSLKVLAMQYNTRWIRHEASDGNIHFDVIQDDELRLIKTLHISIRNITVNYYGWMEIALPIIQQQVLKFRLFISTYGYRNVSFRYGLDTYKTSHWYLQCTANNFPKSILIGKKMTHIFMLDQINNTNHKPNVTLRASPRSYQCNDMGTYQCKVTDFQEITSTYEVDVFLEHCKGLLTLCDWQREHVIINTSIGCQLNVTLCVLTTSGTFPPKAVIQNKKKTFNVSIVKESIYRFVQLSILNLKKEDFKNYTITIGSTLNISITLTEEIGILLLESQTERNVLIQKYEDIIFSFVVQSKDGIRQDIEINKRKVSINTTTKQYSINVRSFGEARYNFTVRILNFTLNSVTKYRTVVHSLSGCPIQYTVNLNVTGLHTDIELCKGENDNKSLTVSLNSTAVVHFCVTSNTSLGDYISIDGKPCQIYGYNHTSKYGVTADKMSTQFPDEHHIQIYIRNLTDDDMKSYYVTIQSTSTNCKHLYFSLFEEFEEYPTGCHEKFPISYYFVKKINDCFMEFCVLSNQRINDTITLNNFNFNLRDTVAVNQLKISYMNDLEKGNSLKYVIKIMLKNMTVDYFTRYDLKITFGHRIWQHTFYLLDEPSSDLPCNPGATYSASTLPLHGNFTFSFRVYGLVNSVNINNRSYPIGETIKGNRWIVKRKWLSNDVACCLQMCLGDILDSDFGRYDISLPSMTRSYHVFLEKQLISLTGGPNISTLVTPEGTANVLPENITREIGTVDIKSITALSVALPLLLSFLCLFIFLVKYKAKIKVFSLKSGEQNNSKTPQGACDQNELYSNLRVLNANQHCENTSSEVNVVSLVDTRNPVRNSRVYMNTGELHDMGSDAGEGHDFFSSLETDRNSNGLVYVTISQCESFTASSGPRSHERNDEVVYATLDFTKTGRLSVKDMERLVKKNSRRQKLSMKKSAMKSSTLHWTSRRLDDCR